MADPGVPAGRSPSQELGPNDWLDDERSRAVFLTVVSVALRVSPLRQTNPVWERTMTKAPVGERACQGIAPGGVMFESAFVSKRFDYHPDNLAEVAAEWHRGLVPVPWVPRTVRVSHGLWLAADPVAGSTEGSRVYKVRGVAWVGPAPVPLSLGIQQMVRDQV